jgi:hypothetical protein
MIRIDEIYNHTFWPYVSKHLLGTRLFFCDPPGATLPENLYNFGEDVQEHSFIYCHDQEPLNFDMHQNVDVYQLWQQVKKTKIYKHSV